MVHVQRQHVPDGAVRHFHDALCHIPTCILNLMRLVFGASYGLVTRATVNPSQKVIW